MTESTGFDAAAFLRILQQLRPPGSIAEFRALGQPLLPILNHDLPPIGAYLEAVRLGRLADRELRVDIAVPGGGGPHPILLFVHGGGWVAGSTLAYRRLAHRLAEAGFLTLNLDYRLAPEHPFPAAFDDCAAALELLGGPAEEHGGDLARLAVVGDSAGANLAAAAAIHHHRRGREPAVRAALFFYGIFDLENLHALFDDGAGDRLITREVLQMMVDGYLANGPQTGECLRDPRLSPMVAAENLPPTLLVVGSQDPFHPQSRALAEAMQRADRPCELSILKGMKHGFVQTDFLPVSRSAIETGSAFLRRWLVPT